LKSHTNRYKPKTGRTHLGEITFAEPQVREVGFYPSALKKGLRSEKVLVARLAKERPLDEITYLYVDTIYEKVR
jgi:putative transposase